jgi:hypothetical protein
MPSMPLPHPINIMGKIFSPLGAKLAQPGPVSHLSANQRETPFPPPPPPLPPSLSPSSFYTPYIHMQGGTVCAQSQLMDFYRGCADQSRAGLSHVTAAAGQLGERHGRVQF